MHRSSPPCQDLATIRTALDQARQSGLQIDALRAANARTIRTLEVAMNGALTGPSSAALQVGEVAGRRHEIRSRIEADEELRAFILARIRTLTFDQVLCDVAARFPPDRRPSRSALHRWWHRHGKHRADAQPAIIG